MMHVFQFAIGQVRKRPLRMGLTLFQIGVGVAAVTIVLSFVFNLLEPPKTGLNTEGLFWAEVEGVMEQGDRKMKVTTSFFTQEMIDSFKEKTNYIEEITLVDRAYQGIIEYDQLRYQFNMGYWIGSEYADLVDLKMLEGSFYTSKDVETQNRVLVISESASKQLFGEQSGVGETLRFGHGRGGQELVEAEVIGVYEDLNQTGSYSHDASHFLFPVHLNHLGEDFMQVLVRFQPGKVQEGKDELLMLFQHEVGQSSQRDRFGAGGFSMSFTSHDNPGGSNRKEVAQMFGLFLGSFAFIALVVSSIGVLSMMLVSIVERTREIGLRRALGATRWSIVRQIVSESVMLSLLGGFLGIVLAFAGIGPIMNGLVVKYVFQGTISVHAHVVTPAILISLLAVSFVGVMAGLYPGIQASRLAPLEAVRDGR